MNSAYKASFLNKRFIIFICFGPFVFWVFCGAEPLLGCNLSVCFSRCLLLLLQNTSGDLNLKKMPAEHWSVSSFAPECKLNNVHCPTWGVAWSNGSVVMGTESGSIRLWRLNSSVGANLRRGPSSLVDLAKVGLGSDNVKEGGCYDNNKSGHCWHLHKLNQCGSCGQEFALK